MGDPLDKAGSGCGPALALGDAGAARAGTTRRGLVRSAAVASLSLSLSLSGGMSARASGAGASAAAGRTPGSGRLRALSVRDLLRADAADGGAWWARDAVGRLWRIDQAGAAGVVAEGVDPSGALATGHGRVACRGLDGSLRVLEASGPRAAQGRSSVRLAPHGGLCVLALAVIGVVEAAGRFVLARFEADGEGRWRVVAQGREPVLPDAVPMAVAFDGRADGAHIAVLAGPDAERYPHAVLGDAIEATQVLWVHRHTLEPLRALAVPAPTVFEDRFLRPWRLPDGRTGLVTVQSGERGGRLVVVAASRTDPRALEIALAGPAIGTRNRWLSPASVQPGEEGLWAVHTPHLGGVLHRYAAVGGALQPQQVAAGLTNHRLGDRELDLSARVGRWLLLPTQDRQGVRAVDTASGAVHDPLPGAGPVLQCVASSHGQALLLGPQRAAVWTP